MAPPALPSSQPAPARRPARRRLLTALRIALCVLLLALLLRVPIWGELRDSLLRAAPAALAAGAAWFLAMTGLDAWRFQVAFRRYRLGYGEALRVHLIGVFLSNFTPGTTGAEAYRVGVVQRLERGLLRPLALLALLRLAGMAAIAALTAVYLLAQTERLDAVLDPYRAAIEPRTAGLAIAAGLAVALALLVLALRQGALGERVRAAWRGAWQAIGEVGPVAAGGVGLLSLSMAVAGSLSLFFLLRSVTTEASVADMIVVLALLTAGSVLPLTPGSLGLREGAVAAGLALFQVSPADAVAVALFHRGCFWLISLAGAVLVLGWPALESR